MKYIKIAATLRDKNVRDVALRCRWITVSYLGCLISLSHLTESISILHIFSLKHFVIADARVERLAYSFSFCLSEKAKETRRL